MSQIYFYPPATANNPSVGTNGALAPTSSTQVAGENPSGNLSPLQTDSSGNLLVSLAATPTSPLDVNLTKVNGSTISLGQTTMSASLPVAIASNQSAIPASQSGTWNINNISGTISLPTGAATESTLSTLNTNVAARLTGSFVPTAFNEVALTYVTVGNGIGQIQTAVYKLSGSTVKTLTLSYDGSDRLSGVVAS